MNALKIEKAGYDWGARAANIVAAISPSADAPAFADAVIAVDKT
jgi:hypothetical protein